MDKEEAKKLKEELIQQILSWNTGEEQKKAAIEKIETMSEKEFEAFLIQNKLIRPEGEKEERQECIFCRIIENKIPYYKLSENSQNLAMLEINPLSKGHVLIVPKKHLSQDSLPVSSFSLAKKLAKKIKERLNPKEVKISSIAIFNHALVEVVPLYENEKGERKKASEAELKELQSMLEIRKKISKPKIKKSPAPIQKEPLKKPSDVLYAPKRIP